MTRLGIALLGAGYAGRIQAAAWQQIPEAQLVGVWDRSEAAARALGAALGVPVFIDLDALLSRSDVQAVDIATSVDAHREPALRAAAAGKHVLCQKPLAPSMEDAVAIVEGCRQAGVRLMVNENWRWRPWYRATRAMLDRGTLGRPFSLHLSLRTDAAVVTPQRPADRLFDGRTFMRTMDPLIMFELGPHYFDIVRYLFGDPDRIYARTFKVSQHVTGEDVASAFLEYSDRTAAVELTWHAIGHTADRSKRLHPDTLQIDGTEGHLAVDEDGQVRIRHRDGREETVQIDTTDAYLRSWRDALQHFAACLISGAPFETSGEQNLGTLALVFAAYEVGARRISRERGVVVCSGQRKRLPRRPRSERQAHSK